MSKPRFANILLSGPCNFKCPECIGQQDTGSVWPNTLNKFPLPGLEELVERLCLEKINQISLTGIDTEPMLYRHQDQLIKYLHSRIPHVKISLHTNGSRILAQTAQFNRYDRATISLPSLDPRTCLTMTGCPEVLDLKTIVAGSQIPLKISVLITEHNVAEIPVIVEYCRSLGIKRMVLRQLYGGTSPQVPIERSWRLHSEFAGNPVYDATGLEVTIWDFQKTTLSCLNLFPDGRISEHYLLKPESIEQRGDIEFAVLPPSLRSRSSLGVMLGSFDPPHRGHAWMVREMLEHFEGILLLLPKSHFHKLISPPFNATLEQRLAMLEEIRAIAPDRIATGITAEVLFLRLDQQLERLFPRAAIGFAMGDENWMRICDSRYYYQLAGIDWTAADAARLESFSQRVLVFDRSLEGGQAISVPDEIREISSSKVRAAAAALGSQGLDLAGWERSLAPLVPSRVAESIRYFQLYP